MYCEILSLLHLSFPGPFHHLGLFLPMVERICLLMHYPKYYFLEHFQHLLKVHLICRPLDAPHPSFYQLLPAPLPFIATARLLWPG
jgi:hypothetical protein